MPASYPPAPDLLAVIREFLERDLLPDLRDDKWFNMKVAINLLATVERELRLRPEADVEERKRLAALLGTDGTVEEQNQRLVDSIRSGALAADDPAVIDHVRRTLVDALRINNPKWLRP
jgi:hypothetical protein